jgi:hypothetical protein
LNLRGRDVILSLPDDDANERRVKPVRLRRADDKHALSGAQLL